MNGKRNGKGKEYYNNGELSYEGEYLNGKRNGNGKEYNYEGQIKIEGEYINDKLWNMKEYDVYNNIVSETTNGKWFFKEFNDDGSLIFEGEYLNGERNGKGKEYKYGNLRFEGEYLNDKKWNGKGYDEKQNIIYELEEGKWKVMEYNYYNNKLIFEGEYLKGERNGRGKEYNYSGKLIFEGEYLNGKRNGKGKEYDNFGQLLYEGEYKNGERKFKKWK